MKGQRGVPSCQQVHSFVSSGHFLSFLFDTGLPAELSIQGHTKVFSNVSIRYLLIVSSNWDVFKASVGKVNMNRFRFIKLDVPFFSIFIFSLWLFVIYL